jgi:hypothetical protein
MSDISMVFFASSTCGIDDAHAALARSLAVTRMSANELAVAWPSSNGPTLHIYLVIGPQVADEGRDIAATTPHAAAMRRCDARFEIVIDDLATALDEMNTLIEAQLTLQDLTGGLLFNTWTGKLTSN